MDQKEFSDYMSTRYEGQIIWYDSRAAKNRFMYRWLQGIILVFAGITPILIEVKPTLLIIGVFQWATLTAAIVAILTAGLKVFKFQENWISYRTTCDTLQKEKYYHAAEAGAYRNSEDKNALFVERVESLISHENTMWLMTQKPK